MAGSLLAAVPGEEVLVAVNVVPLYSATPELLAGIAMAQAHAALEMSSSILASRSESGHEDDDDDDDDDEFDDDDRELAVSPMNGGWPDHGAADDEDDDDRDRGKV
jgi:hypothetical protein